MGKKVAGVTILYHPGTDVIDHIATYLDKLDVLILVDNSPERSQAVFTNEFLEDPKVIRVRNAANEGMARALNQGATLALEKGCDFLLTMDQDSEFKPHDFEKMLSLLGQVDTAKIGIIAPVHHHHTATLDNATKALVDVKITMTSGNLLNLEAYRVAGPFDEALFIDHVDHEYCLRLLQRGFRIVENRDILLIHALGYVTEVSGAGKPLTRFVSHSPLRTYYMIRNGLFVANKYRRDFPWFYRKNLVLMFKELAKVVFQDNRIQRLRMFFLGINHYCASRMGKLKIEKN
jgi:rhamnosyltransferase